MPFLTTSSCKVAALTKEKEEKMDYKASGRTHSTAGSPLAPFKQSLTPL